MLDALLGWLDANSISLINGLARGLLLFMAAAGLSLIFGLMDVLNLAHGTAFMLGAYFMVTFAADGQGFLLAVALVVIVGAAFGGLLKAAMRPIAGRGHLEQVLVTLGLVYVFKDLQSLAWGNQFYSVRPPDVLSGSIELLGLTFPLYRLAVIVFGLLIALAVYVAFARTQLGAIVRATVLDQDMVAAVGISVNRVQIAVFCIGSALAALGGALSAPLLSISPGIDDEALLLALIIVVIGGMGSLLGAFLASLLVGQIQTTVTAQVPEVAGFLLFGTMAVILLFRPYGLLGRRAPA